MSEKHDLAVLYSMIDRPITEFVESEPFKRLEQETDLICRIEPFGLPEIKKLICCSDILASQDWADKYAEARKLYTTGMNFDVLALLLEYKDAAEFEAKILACVDSNILARINAYFTEIKQENEKDKKELSSLKRKIKKDQKKSPEKTSSEASSQESNVEGRDGGEVDAGAGVQSALKAAGATSGVEVHMEELNKAIGERDKFLTVYKKHALKTKEYLAQLNNIEVMDSKRQEAYKTIDEVKPSVEESFLCHYIQTGELSIEEEESLRDYGFLHKVIALLDKSNYTDVAFPVLAKLHSDSAIDLESDVIAEFISAHGRLLAEYLESQYSEIPGYLEDEENRLFLEYAIKGTISGSDEYVPWWNSISRVSDWKAVLETVAEIIDDSLLKVAVKLLHHVNGSSMDAFMKLVESDQADAFGITPAEFVIELVGQEAPEQKNLVRGCIRSADQNVRKLQRKVAAEEREINRHSQELFSALYQPLEQLEQLAVNLRLSDGEIKCSLVARHVIDALSVLRENLAALGLDTADEVKTWKQQSFVEYDPEKHRMPSMIGTAGEQVKLQTLGFSYTDDEGNNKIRAAEVYIPAPVEEPPVKVTGEKSAGKNQKKHVSDTTPSKIKKGYPKNGSVVKKPKRSSQSLKGKKK